MNIAEQDALHSMLERIDALTETMGIAHAAPMLNAHIASRIFGEGGLDEVLSYAAAAGYRVSKEPWLWLDGQHMNGTAYDSVVSSGWLSALDPHGELKFSHLSTAVEAYKLRARPIGSAKALPLDEQRVQVVTGDGVQFVYDKLTYTWRRA